MSVTMSVFVHSNKLPQPTAWAQAIRSNGFPMELSTGFDVRKQAGFVPCTYDGQKAGFEYRAVATKGDELGDPERQETLEGRDLLVSFTTESNPRGTMTSVIASAVLASLTDGVVWDTQSDDLIFSSDAIGWGKELEESLKDEL